MKNLLLIVISLFLASCASVTPPRNSWKYETDTISSEQFQELLAETKSIKNAEIKEDKDFINIVINPEKSETGDLTVFVFTKAGNSNHPAAARIIKSRRSLSANPKVEFHRVGKNPAFEYFVRTIMIDATLRL